MEHKSEIASELASEQDGARQERARHGETVKREKSKRARAIVRQISRPGCVLTHLKPPVPLV